MSNETTTENSTPTNTATEGHEASQAQDPKKLFVGNLPFDVNDADLVTVFSVVGKVRSAKVVLNKKTGRSKGYGFVEMDSEELAKEAVQKFEGATLNERAITVALASAKPPREPKPEVTATTGEANAAVETQTAATESTA